MSKKGDDGCLDDTAIRASGNCPASDPYAKFSIRIRQTLNVPLGITIAVLCGLLFAKYMHDLHETKLWFSNISQMEREISLRTEAGLYYSYFKFAVQPQISLNESIHALMFDNTTEYPRTMNVLQRFNIYQELALALLYKFLDSIDYVRNILPTPILFYVYACFLCAGFGLTTLFMLAWKVNHGWIYGLLVFIWVIANLEDSTRVFFTVNLRENFALPFFWLQNLCVASVFSMHSMANSVIHYQLFFASTFLFSLFWQFNQFVLLLQSSSLYVVALIIPNVAKKAVLLLILQSLAFLLVVASQFGQSMAAASISIAFNISVIIIFILTKKSTRNSFSQIFLKFFAALLLTAAFSWSFKYVTGTQSDSHIWTFVKAKVGLQSSATVPFETALYLCHGAFAYLDAGFYQRTSLNGCFPLYLLSVIIILALYLYSIIKSSKSGRFYGDNIFDTKILYITIQSVLCGVIAIFTARMKYLWFPQIAVVACCIPKALSKHLNRTTHVAVFAVIFALINRQYNIYKEEMANEQEFYDPDTVDLMEWIMKSTKASSSWSGSMQLMAGVKACTGRWIANHPHFEDKWLRERTLRLYQVYGRKTLEEVHEILRREKVDYIILEDSICLAASTGCSTNDLVDIANGDAIQLKIDSGKTVSSTLGERFCDRIRHQDSEMPRLFKIVFENHTFRVYRVLSSS